MVASCLAALPEEEQRRISRAIVVGLRAALDVRIAVAREAATREGRGAYGVERKETARNGGAERRFLSAAAVSR